MPSPELDVKYRRQKAVLWPFTGYDAYGQPKVGSPVELKVRWVDKQSEALDSQGNTITIDATVVVDRQISVDSVMWLGAITDLVGTAQAPPSNVMFVKAYNGTSDIKNRVIRRTVSLSRLKGVLPNQS